MIGPLDADAVGELERHLRQLVVAGSRFVVLDVSGAESWCPTMVDLLGRMQRRLTGRRGMISMVGMSSELLATADAPPERTKVLSAAR